MAEALLALDAAERLMEPSGSPGAMQLAGDRGRSRTGFSPSSAPAPIGGGSTPDANEDFRKRLLEAAKRRAPEGWSERVRRYWRAVRQ
jgi:hypothetical protein